MRQKPVVLCILDGWGERADREDNAVALGHTPNWDRYVADLPLAHLNASAGDVGLPLGQMGNSEVGHTNIGAGRVVMQDLPRIDKAVADGSLAKNPVLLDFMEKLQASGGACHLLGLLSPGGVHSHSNHLLALVDMLCRAKIPVAVHAFLDGRDTPPKSGLGYMNEFEDQIRNFTGAGVATVCGRYYAMDRDNRWDRVSKAYELLVDGVGDQASDAASAISSAYENNLSDEFVLPAAIGDYGGMADGDGLLMANFRADRAREILGALVDPDFDDFPRKRAVTFAARLGMVSYSGHLDGFFAILFPPGELKNILGQVVAEAGMAQLRIAETEKYAHVTFFFNGGREQEFVGEERILVASPQVATYDLKPEMSACKVTDKLVQAIAEDCFDLIIVNYANGDMVGHTGILAAAIKATEVLDDCLGRLEKAVVQAGGVMLVTADHGNCEQMLDRSGDPVQPHTAHTTNTVPLVMINGPDRVKGFGNGKLADLAPTLLALLDLPQPVEMTGQNLIKALQ